MEQHSKDVELYMDLVLNLTYARKMLIHQIQVPLSLYNLTHTQFQALLYLNNANRPVVIKDFNMALSIDYGTASPMIARMKKRGIIHVEFYSPSDNRQKTVTITAQGKRIVDKVMQDLKVPDINYSTLSNRLEGLILQLEKKEMFRNER